MKRKFILSIGFPLALSVAFLIFSACSSAPRGRVVETDEGNLAALGSAKESADARIAALDQATDYCSASNQKPLFKEDELKGKFSGKKFDFNLKDIPVVGRAFQSEDTNQVILTFRCGEQIS